MSSDSCSPLHHRAVVFTVLLELRLDVEPETPLLPAVAINPPGEAEFSRMKQ